MVNSNKKIFLIFKIIESSLYPTPNNILTRFMKKIGSYELIRDDTVSQKDATPVQEQNKYSKVLR